jgi:hypothetical protein
MKFIYLEREHFIEYMDNLQREQENSEKPFNCPKLITLPEDIFIYEDLKEKKFEKGTLICRVYSGMGFGSIKCNIRSDIKLNEDGNLEILCGLSGSKFEIGIKSFKYREPWI